MIIAGRDIPVGVSALHYKWETVEDACRIARDELGVEIIEFSYRGEEGLSGAFDPNLREIRKARDSFAGEVRFSLHAWFNIPAAGAVTSAETLKRTAEFAYDAGAAEAVLHMGKYPDRKKGIEILKDSLSRAMPHFESAGAVLLLENHYAYDYKGLNELGGEPGDFLDVFRDIKSPNLGFCLDYGHSHMCGNTNEFIEALAPYLKYAHLADNFGDEDSHLAFGEGNLDWGGAFEKTLGAGFAGPFIAEYPATAETVRRFKRLLGEIILRREKCRDNI